MHDGHSVELVEECTIAIVHLGPNEPLRRVAQ